MLVHPELMTEVEAAAYIRVMPNTMSVWRSARRYDIPYLKIGRLVRYRENLTWTGGCSLAPSAIRRGKETRVSRYYSRLPARRSRSFVGSGRRL